MQFLYFSKIRSALVASPSRPVCARYRERPRGVLASLCGVLAGLIVSLCVFLVSLVCVCALTSCTRHHYTVVHDRSVSQDSSVSRTSDTLRIYVRDSISQKQIHDTIIKEKFRIVYRDRVIRDTVHRIIKDTIAIYPDNLTDFTEAVAEPPEKLSLNKIIIILILIVFIVIFFKIKFKNF